jgi:hypothetical protein
VEISRARARGEIAAVVLTGAVFLVFENLLNAKLPFLLIAALGWTAYVVARLRSTPGLGEAWGLGRSNFNDAAKGAGSILAAGVAGLVVYRLLLGWRPLPAGAPLLFLVYPLWAFLQQFTLQALVAGNLSRLGVAKGVVIVAAAVLFGLAHLPDWPLVGICAAAGAAWTALYLRAPNLWPLAASHAWLGALAYYWVLERDPWREMFPAGG